MNYYLQCFYLLLQPGFIPACTSLTGSPQCLLQLWDGLLQTIHLVQWGKRTWDRERKMKDRWRDGENKEEGWYNVWKCLQKKWSDHSTLHMTSKCYSSHFPQVLLAACTPRYPYMYYPYIYIHTLVWAFSFSRVSSLICLNKICFSSSSCPLIFCCTSASSATWAWRSSCSTACCWNNCSSSSKTLTVCGNVHVYHDCTWRIWLAGQIPKANSVS